VNSTSEEGR